MQFQREFVCVYMSFESATTSQYNKRAPQSPDRGATHLYVKRNYLTLNAA